MEVMPAKNSSHIAHRWGLPLDINLTRAGYIGTLEIEQGKGQDRSHRVHAKYA